MSRRVVITGLECITPLGSTVKNSWLNLLDSKNCFTDIKSLPNYETLYKPFIKHIPEDLKVGICEHYNSPEKLFSAQDNRRMTPLIKNTISTIYTALNQSDLLEDNSPHVNINPERVSVSIGTGLPPIQEIYDTAVKFHTDQKRPSPMFIHRVLPNMVAGSVSIKFNARGPSQTVSTACATGNNTIIEGFNTIQNNMADVAIVGATESSLHPLTIAGFHRLKSISSTSTSKPFDMNRDGFIISEGTGVIILEELNNALKRIKSSNGKVKILGELVGVGLSSDAYHITSPNENGIGAQKSMEMALKNANISFNEVDFINAHATSTQIGDKAELTAIHNIFSNENRKKPLYVTSNKGAMGHLLGASGLVESIFTILSLQNGIIPHTLNLENELKIQEGRQESNICLVKDTPVKNTSIEYAITNSFGFGGVNTSLLFKKW